MGLYRIHLKKKCAEQYLANLRTAQEAEAEVVATHSNTIDNPNTWFYVLLENTGARSSLRNDTFELYH
ncbi:hypothetical protein E2C01_071649 [Portunus trituberculatus]|uniref:Uncharacterized protein n=1 Tax=Portunus trituberculatus TaxID=210409 RepID=A0A5B7HVV8_PORTR|nr:hypothetical protein [Portunus trituberculatus]